MKQFVFVFILFISIFFSCKEEDSYVKFAIISDIHQDIAHDGVDRLQTFIDVATEQNVDFIIELGDFCFPKEENKSFLSVWNSFPNEKYHVLGNHDMDVCSKEVYMAFVGMQKRYYSFDKGNFHFIVLDPNNFYRDDTSFPYDKGNYFAEKEINHIDAEQIEWLKKDLLSTKKRCILFSHESLENTVTNREKMRKILEEENERVGFKKIPLVFSGHDHTNYKKEINGIVYFQLNSASNQWVGEQYACEERFSAEINKSRPAVKYTVPYTDALYGIVTLTDSSISMKGKKSSFIPPTPSDLNIPDDIYPFPLTSEISDLFISLDQYK